MERANSDAAARDASAGDTTAKLGDGVEPVAKKPVRRVTKKTSE
jgi:hypothetical protein